MHRAFPVIGVAGLLQVPSPFKPEVGQEDSTEIFDRVWTDLPAEDSPCCSPCSSLTSELDFACFTYMCSYCVSSLLAEQMMA